jgi:hypothetical protein
MLVLSVVADSGCGMKPEELADVLKPAYTQARSNGTNCKFQGTDLGLFICLPLCQQLAEWLYILRQYYKMRWIDLSGGYSGWYS